MGRFNLLDEPWISVIISERGQTKEVSLIELFQNAHTYKGLAGDTKAQDFAVFRVLLAVLQSVFSRFDADGKEHGYFVLDHRWKPINTIEDEDDKADYEEALYYTWLKLWEAKKFPEIIVNYLEKWRDRFYLFDEKYPFYQVIAQDIGADKISKAKASQVSGKNINRLISESGNKIALFSPKYGANNNKNKLSPEEIARWLIMFQGYTGLSDKVIFGKDKYKASKGWLFDIGGIYLQGNTLFKSLMLNCVLVHPEKSQDFNSLQRPCWEFSSEEIIYNLLQSKDITNLAELYTNWSRAIYIDPNKEIDDSFSLYIVKLPEIRHDNQFLELMTLWRFNNAGENKGLFTPRKHNVNQSIWRSFGLITLSYSAIDSKEGKVPQRKPGIIDWLNTISEEINDFTVLLQAISIKDDGNATSWVPVDEIFDVLNIKDAIITDIEDAGWVPRINDVIEETKRTIEWTYKDFIADIKEIRNMSTNYFVRQKVEELYFIVDQPFRNWLASIRPTDSKDARILEWNRKLKKLVLQQSKQVVEEAGPRDYQGIVKENRIKNIATTYNYFNYRLNKQLNEKGGKQKWNQVE